MQKSSFDQIASSFHPLIVSMIKRFHIYKDFDEYYQVALIGLWRAYQKFDESKGSFSAYAYTTVRGTILSYLKGNALREERETPASSRIKNKIGEACLSFLSTHRDQNIDLM